MKLSFRKRNQVKPYFSFFRIRFSTGTQYRFSMITGLMTQFLWGLMECFAYRALHDTNSSLFPMTFSAVVSYIWLKEAFFCMFNTWMTDGDIFQMIVDGSIAYELCRPISIYRMWFARNIGGRLSASLVRSIPIMIGAFLLPKPYCMTLPKHPWTVLFFLISLFIGLFVTVSFCMIVYISCFFTISPQGLRMLLTGAVEFLSGAIIPIPFVPYPFRTVLELLPFSSMQNVPLRIYSGDLAGRAMVHALLLQVIWCFLLYGFGRLLCKLAQHRVIVQGG